MSIQYARGIKGKVVESVAASNAEDGASILTVLFSDGTILCVDVLAGGKMKIGLQDDQFDWVPIEWKNLLGDDDDRVL